MPAPSGPLITALTDSDEYVRKTAAEALGKIGDASSVDPLVAVLKDSNKYLRQRATTALGEIGDARSMEPLIAMLRDGDEEIRKHAAEALEKIGWQPRQDIDGASYWAAKQEWKTCIQIGPAAVEPLIAALKDSHWVVRQNAAVALREIGDARAVEPLITALDDEIKHVRQDAARALLALYQSQKLDDHANQRILALRTKIAEPHSDNSHECGGHTDRGIGVDFPL